MMKEKNEQVVEALYDLIIAHKAAGKPIDENVACVASAAAQLAQITSGRTTYDFADLTTTEDLIRAMRIASRSASLQNKETAGGTAVECAEDATSNMILEKSAYDLAIQLFSFIDVTMKNTTVEDLRALPGLVQGVAQLLSLLPQFGKRTQKCV